MLISSLGNIISIFINPSDYTTSFIFNLGHHIKIKNKYQGLYTLYNPNHTILIDISINPLNCIP